MTFFPMVPIAWLLAQVWLGEPTANNRHHALIGSRSRQNRRPSTAWENFRGNRLSWRSRLFPIALTPKPATRDQRFGKNIFKTVYHGDFPKKKRESRQIQRLAGGLGKFEWEPVYHGHHAFFRWRSRQNPRPSWGNPKGKRFIMAISPGKATVTPKPATSLGKIEWEAVYHGDRENKRDPIGEAIGMSEAMRIRETMRDGRSTFIIQNHLLSS